MKKNVRKMVAVLLAMVLTLGALPVVAMAEEADTRAVPICEHLYTIVNDYITTERTATTHTIQYNEIYTCTKCGYSYRVEPDPVTRDHEWVYMGLSATGLYWHECMVCGYDRYRAY